MSFMKRFAEATDEKCLEYIEIHEPVISVRHNSVGFTFIQQINRH